jgi:integrase
LKKASVLATEPSVNTSTSVPSHSTSLTSITFDKYIESVASVNEYTAYNYRLRLAHFASFVNQKYNLTLDELIKQLQSNRENNSDDVVDVYDLLSSYVAFLRNRSNNVPSPLSTKLWISTIRNFLESFDVEISSRKFKLKVRMPSVIRQSKEALTKEDVVNILNACSEIKLKTYCMFLAATGCRASEAISIRLCDLDFSDKPSKVFIRGEYTKTTTDRYVFLTKELVEQLNKWIDFKYRTRRVSYIDKKTGKSVTETRSPDRTKRMNDLVFASSITKEHRNLSIRDVYSTLLTTFDKTLDRMGGVYAEYEDGPDNTSYRRRKITLHSFRRFVKSTISDLGYSDFSEWFIGHSGSTYYRKSVKEKAELFRKIESSLTFLDFLSLERKGADVQSKIEVLEQENYALRQRDSFNTDAIQNLSDQLMKVMAEVQELKKH